ncbi:alanine--tRNA ligase [Candidatus Roizmanbacteria bacterium CG02_land_8_20_14_3_00_36_15]|uniref:alanine--tRNA ligase n=1 Tax=Candidatus Roizmanbacteria bacterium CG10_big_fil_rev_8_21_14_0_10_36_26 TaxID=1974851 RepID=A0A2M8KJT9_9BACT|nr:MAG: alanine--tRNA ligase [Candidatus Roizmanbacteria bacterium CG03_land_8_20_14_0_80_36_21]PIV38155.1 MAG: alanine--tRNA ligase [Candidatus Roizmanbacteria bacterium CG02_land_8_20_14_3_00_36_15]PIY69609.1 MAG: alanine--tRNA ligase [Candidatus Roizmanbacteria bacterium CG_4_10_14_0_8_um_filter_36_36]PJA53668.1 MAG: alanine--tRNA ligase [Candidatus Roizmanbacteria bacterium CG_4_9_14_3_um_filter_36_11]PJE60190.1 MAG: alanine--tRNA ligase [Candidatus Roizmanbacteria bacterium CG10_big_fil_re
MNINHIKLRLLFSNFWKKRGHKEVPPIPLVPQNDPTTLFTGSGMQQLVPNLLGEIHPLGKKLYNIQRCIRAQDIEEVGDNRHDTFFEMMGNWSLGDYFKKEQLTWCWEFLTQELKLSKERLYVTVFWGTKDIPADEESFQIWRKIGLPENRILRYDTKTNWWSRAGLPENMPAGEPGGRTSEIFYEFTQIIHNPKYGKTCHPNCSCGRFIEIGNSVFMEYKKNSEGTLSELPAKDVDFGGGLERITMALENQNDLFLTNVFTKTVSTVEKITKKKYLDFKKPIRIISDHIKTSVFLIKEGVTPSNKEQGYILRRLLRKTSFNLHKIGVDLKQALPLEEIVESVIDTYGNIYFNKEKDLKMIVPIIKEEMDKFGKALSRGIKEIEKTEEKDLENKAFYFYQSYGLPLEFLEEIFKNLKKKINIQRFREEFNKHKELSRSASVGKFKGGLADHSTQSIKYHTVTHLLHQALFDVLGNNIRQEGSNITSERLRFDFYSTKKPTTDQIKKVESTINGKINHALEVSFKIIHKSDALKIGAKSFFREKYPEMVKIYFINNYSKEFCGGPHVKNTQEIGQIKIFRFEKIGSNLYRIYAK